MKNNRIPRKFKLIVGKMLIDTSMSKINDILHITKDEYGYHALNTRTQNHSAMFVSMIRNGEIFEVVSIE